VATMARIACYTEEHYGAFRTPERVSIPTASVVANALARVARTVAEELGCKLIIAFTESGTTAHLLSTYRPRAPIAAVTYNPDTYRRLGLWWGVVPVKSDFAETTDEMIVKGETLLKAQGLIAKGDTVLMLAGQSHTAGATNMLRVHTIS
jgi:pyruvate kinase